MFRILASTAIAAALLTAPAMAAVHKVKEVDVGVDVGAINNTQAAQYWANLGPDLEGAIMARLIDETDAEKGAKVSIDISEVELSNTFQNITNLAETKLVGNVNVTSETDNSAFNSYELTVNVEQARAFFPEGTDLAALTLDTPVYYQAMVDAFANAVVERLEK